MPRTYKFRIYPSKKQEAEMGRHPYLAKNLWNELLAFSKQVYKDYGLFPTKNTLQLTVKNAGLFSQTQQEIAHRVSNATFRVFKMRKQGKAYGFPRFKSIDRMKSLHYPQFGVSLGKKLEVSPFGEIAIKKHREVKGRIKTLALKREPSGKWFAIFCVEQETTQPKENKGPRAGIDLGLLNLATLSNGTIIKNPRHLKKHAERLASCQRLFSRKRKGSRNRKKMKFKVARVYEKVSNTRADFLHKISTKLVNDYSSLALEKLASKEMSEQNFGKSIHDAGWNMFANMLAYKAEEAGCRIVFVNPKDTTKECSSCGELSNKTLRERQHNCPYCGLSMDRDLNAAKVILKRATAGIAGSNASGDETKVLPMKEEALPFRTG